MFRVDDLATKISELKLGDIIEKGATEDDYRVDLSKYEPEEFKRPVVVRFDIPLTRATGILLKKYKCSSNILMKSATKLGAMLLYDSMKLIEDINWFMDVVYSKAQELEDVPSIYLIDSHSEEMADTVNRFRPRHYKLSKIQLVYPYPRWRLVLDKYSWVTFISKSEVYRGAIALAYQTEVKLSSAQEFNNWVNIISSEFLNTLHRFCNVFKNSASFIKHGYADYLKYIPNLVCYCVASVRQSDSCLTVLRLLEDDIAKLLNKLGEYDHESYVKLSKAFGLGGGGSG